MGVPVGDVEIRDLSADGPIVERLIGWQIAHYRKAFPSFDRDDSLDFYAPLMRRHHGSLPVLLGAFVEGECTGTVAIVERDDLDDVDGYTPWIAAMIVDPERRGSGTGTALLEAAVARCRDMRFELVYLWTHDMQDWYAQLGWEKVEERSFRNVSITIFKLDPIL